jgi:hypothetical protein
LQLQFLGHPRQLGGGRRREDDLKCVHNQSENEGSGDGRRESRIKRGNFGRAHIKI